MNRARKWSKPEAQEELAYIQDVLTGKISLSSFNDDWATFSRYAKMQANQAAHSGFVDIADVMQASANRARRKVTKNPKPRSARPGYRQAKHDRKIKRGMQSFVRDATRRVAIKRQLRRLGVTIPDSVMTDIRKLRAIRAAIPVDLSYSGRSQFRLSKNPKKFVIKAQGGKYKAPLYWDGQKFSDTAVPKYFSTFADAQQNARRLKDTYAVLKDYRVWASEEFV